MGQKTDFPWGLRTVRLLIHLFNTGTKKCWSQSCLTEVAFLTLLNTIIKDAVNTLWKKSCYFKYIPWITRTCAAKGCSWAIYGTWVGGDGGSRRAQHYGSIWIDSMAINVCRILWCQTQWKLKCDRSSMQAVALTDWPDEGLAFNPCHHMKGLKGPDLLFRT